MMFHWEGSLVTAELINKIVSNKGACINILSLQQKYINLGVTLLVLELSAEKTPPSKITVFFKLQKFMRLLFHSEKVQNLNFSVTL